MGSRREVAEAEKVKFEIEQLYELMKSELDDTARSAEEYRSHVDDATARAYDKGVFKHIRKTHLKQLSFELITTRSHQRRDFIGTLCKVIINQSIPTHSPYLKKARYGVKELYDLYKKLN